MEIAFDNVKSTGICFWVPVADGNRIQEQMEYFPFAACLILGLSDLPWSHSWDTVNVPEQTELW